MQLTTFATLASLLAVSQVALAAPRPTSSTVVVVGSGVVANTDTATCVLPGLISDKKSKAYAYYNYVATTKAVNCIPDEQAETANCKYTVVKDPTGAVFQFTKGFGDKCTENGGNYKNQVTPNSK